MKEELVRDGRTLRGLEKRRLISEPPPAFRPGIKAKWGKDYHYVDELCSGWQRVGKREFCVKYIDGGFFPVVFMRECNNI